MNEKGPGVYNARSVHGCWTCRLRRKKCDEIRPSCAMCTCLEIQCGGYGAKPEWMDRGPLERAKALQLKQTIRHNKQRGRKQSSSKLPTPILVQVAEENAVSPLNHLGVNDTSNFLDSLEISSFDRALRTSQQNYQFRLPQDFSDVETAPMQGSQLTSPVQSLFLNNSSDSGTIQQLCHPFTNILGGLNMDVAQPRIQFVTPPRSLSPSILDVTMWDDSCMATFNSHPRGSSSSNSGSSRQSSVEESSENQIEKSSLPGSSILDHSQSDRQADSSQVKTNDTHTEDMLFIHYLDEVFPIQFPLYHSLGRRGRGWLFSKLRRAKSAYYGCLALSQQHQDAICSRTSPTTARAFSHYDNRAYKMALDEMQKALNSSCEWNKTMKLSHNLETLTCILHLLFCEIYPSGTNRWQMRLHDASLWLPALVDASVQGNTAMAQMNSDQPGPCLDETNSVETAEVKTTLSFYLGHFVVLDILACVSTRSSPFLNLDHKEILRKDTYGIDLRTIIGCENWVMDILFDIAMLDTWKKNAKKAKKLSIVELASRGARIDLQLRGSFAELDAPSASVCALQPLASAVHVETTKIFALSAMTYLHVVLSGAYPDLPEIADSVGKTIHAFQSLTDRSHFPRLSWCFCITGCLALEPQQGSFREIFMSAQLDEWSTGTCFQALEIMEECWQIRKNSASCDWVSAMDKRGEYALLF